MSYRVKSISVFERQARKLSKKYPSLKSELQTLIQKLINKPSQGIPIGKDCYKIRIAIKSKGKGKSGGARLITHIVVANSKVYLLNIFDKSDKANITQKELIELLSYIEE